MSDLDQLDLEKLSELTTGDSKHFKEEVRQMDLTLQDLRALKKAEASGKDRGKVLEFLDEQITRENVGAYLGLAEEDIGELGDLINEIERLEDIKHFEEEEIEIDQDSLIDLVGGTVDEMKEFINDRPLTGKQIENVLEAEKRVKDRKTAKKFLEKKAKERDIGEDVKQARKDLEKLKEDLNSVKEDEDIEENSGDETSEKDSEEVDENTEPDNSDENEDVETDKDNREGEASENKSEKVQREDDGEGETDSEDSDEDQEEKDNLEKKKEIAEELELEMKEEEIQAFSVKDLEKIRSEKRHREDLIERLGEEGMSEKELRNSSTDDLEKIASGLDRDEEEKAQEAQEEHEEMREEAEEDLEMLMGAVRDDEENSRDDSGKNTREKIEDLKNSIREKLDRSGDDEENASSGINADRVQEILDQYRELDDDEAMIKTAHIMKGFLEKSLGIERELTYKELAENMPEENQSMEELADFFLKMHREQYTGELNINDSDELIDTGEEVISQFS